VSAAALLTLNKKHLALAASSLLCFVAMAQTPQVEVASPPIATESAISAPNNMAIKKPTTVPKAQWFELTLDQQRALSPLSSLWPTLSEPQRKKWLAISKNFPALPEGEQVVMHSRMAEWASLTPQQRTQARLNFGETSKIPLVEKKAQWEAYLALSDEEKRKLSVGQSTTVGGAAPAQRPVNSDKLSHVQSLNGQAPVKGKTPGVKDLDQKTLLPTNKASPTKLDVPAT
jgi:hypothetical protein